VVPDVSPILVAYDASPPAKTALARAGALFPGRSAVIATVWEPGLAAAAPDPAGIGGPAAPLDLAQVAEVDEIMSKRAADIAAEGAARASPDCTRPRSRSRTRATSPRPSAPSPTSTTWPSSSSAHAAIRA
jgi:hypothetical protein